MAHKNVVLVIVDQHRWDFTGYETGNGVTHTPNLDALAFEGTRFNAAYCTSPLCCPSRAALASGRYGMNTGCFTNLHELSPETPTFVSQFRGAGYRTCAIGKTHMEIHAYDSDLTGERHRQFMDSLGWDEVHEISGNGMFRTGIRCAYSDSLRERDALDAVLAFYEQWPYFMDKEKSGDPAFCPHAWPLDESLQETTFVGDRAVDWIQRQDSDVPFFLHVGFAAPHSPVEPNPRFSAMYDSDQETPAWNAPYAPAWLEQGRRGYRAMISQIDHHVGRIREALRTQGLLENTILVYASDHGEMAGDQGRFGKTCFFEGSIRVPLVISGPDVTRGMASPALVELIDVGRTLCDLCDVAPHALDQGMSLAPLLTGQTETHRQAVYAEMGCDRMICNGKHKLMWGDPGSDHRSLGRLHLDKPVNIAPSPVRLYDLEEDPRESRDISGDPAHRKALDRMMILLLSRIAENTQAQPEKSRGPYRPLRSQPASTQHGSREGANEAS